MVMLNKNQQCQEHIFVNSAKRIGKLVFLKVLSTGYNTGTIILHKLCSIFYKGRGKVVPPIKNELLLRSATKLAADIREGKIKCESVVKAYIVRIKEVEPYINATTYQRFSEAIQEAREVDKLVASGSMSARQLEKEKPLLGIPISVKILIQIKGLPFTGASLDSADVIATEDADVIKFMKKAGAIVLATTNAPEKGLHVETFNKLHGRTNNPYDTSRSPGGSTGGEGALIGAGASLLGLGNDTAGSIRMPAQFCGIFGHKPSPELVSSYGQFCNIGEVTSIGPMCRYAEDLVVAMKVLTMDKENTNIYKKVDFKRIKLYYLTTMGDAFCSSLDCELEEAMHKVLLYFENTYGNKASKVNIPLLKESENIFRHHIISASGDTDNLKKVLKIPQEVSPSLELIKYLSGISKYTITVPFLLSLLKCPVWYRLENVQFYRDLLQQLNQQFESILDENSIILCPTLPKVALHHLEAVCIGTSLSYVGIWNYLKLPATHCPLGLNSEGLPLGIQVVCSRNNDGLNLAVACELERAFGGWVPPKEKQAMQ